MNSLSSKCQEAKEKYDACFNSWFSDRYLKGHNENECEPMFKVYQKCIKVNQSPFIDFLSVYCIYSILRKQSKRIKLIYGICQVNMSNQAKKMQRITKNIERIQFYSVFKIILFKNKTNISKHNTLEIDLNGNI